MKVYLMKNYLLILLLFPLTVWGQQEYEFNQDKSKLSLIIDKRKTKLSLNNLMVRRQGQPLPEAKLYSLGINMDTIGVWKSLGDGRNAWMMEIDVPEAKGFFVSFDKFYLPKGAQLYVYNKNNSKDAIVYTNEDNPKGGAYSLENLSGDNVILEYVATETLLEKPIIKFYDLGYKYITGETGDSEGFNSPANACMTNASCPAADYWENQRKGILRIRIRKGGVSSLCSGSLINNTNNDKTPYVLSAEHCFRNVSADDVLKTEVYFDYDSPTCTPNNLPTYKFHKGAELLVLTPMKGSSDGALIKLTGSIPTDWDVYYNGWELDNNGNNVTDGSVIHHPKGDIKKITFYNRNLISGKWDDDDPTAPDGTHWIVRYSSGATEEGSSGAPIFNQNGLIVGTLSGGYSSCNSQNGYDYYGKFWYHWDQHPDTNLHMKKYLDPDNTGLTEVGGLQNNEGVDPGPNPEQQPDIVYYIDGDKLRVYAKDIIKKIRVVNLHGNTVFSKTDDFSSSVYDISIDTWRNGVYVLSVDMEGRSTKSIKIIK